MCNVNVTSVRRLQNKSLWLRDKPTFASVQSWRSISSSHVWYVNHCCTFLIFFFSLIFLSSCFSLYLRAENPQRDYWCVIFHLDNPVCFMHIYVNLSLFSLLITWLTVLLPMAPDDLSSVRMKHQFRLNPRRLGTWPILFFFFCIIFFKYVERWLCPD